MSGPGLSEAEALAAFLAERDAACPNCAYNLRGLKGANCPECGLALELRVNLQRPRLAAYLLGLVPLAMGTGFHAVLLLVLLVMLGVRRAGGPDRHVYIGLLAGTLLLAVPFALWLRGLSWLRRRSDGGRRMLVGGAWLWTVLVVTIASAVIFS